MIPISKRLFIFDLDDTLHLPHTSEIYKKEYEEKLKCFFKALICQNKTLAIATHNSNPQELLERMGIYNMFYIISSPKLIDMEDHMSGNYTASNIIMEIYLKPKDNKVKVCLIENKASMIQKIMEVTGYQADDVLFFDDSKTHIQCARNIGVDSVLVDPEFGIDIESFKLK